MAAELQPDSFPGEALQVAAAEDRRTQVARAKEELAGGARIGVEAEERGGGEDGCWLVFASHCLA